MKFLFKNEVIDYDFINDNNTSTILFLHGWGGDKFSFLQTIKLLKNQFNILSITMPTISPSISVWNMFDYVQLVENILSIHNIKNPILICHSFGCRVAMLLNKRIYISKIIVTGGAGLKKENIFLKINKNNNKVLLKNEKNQYLFKKIASKDYLSLSNTNKKTFQNIVNLNLKFLAQFNCPMLLFWGAKDHETPLWIAKCLKRQNNAQLFLTKSDHFAFINESSRFNHEVLKFLKST